jgi:hypothetical protein
VKDGKYEPHLSLQRRGLGEVTKISSFEFNKNVLKEFDLE